MLDRLAVYAALAALALTLGACASAAPDAAKPTAATTGSAFDAWSSGNGTGAFFKSVGPAGGTGVRTGWPQ